MSNFTDNPNVRRDVHKIKKVIQSCKTPDHFIAAEKMIELFNEKWCKTTKDKRTIDQIFMASSTLHGYRYGVLDAILKGL